MAKKWYAVNSVIVQDIEPDLREPGGGVTEDMMFDTKREAIMQCIIYLNHHINRAQKRIRMFERQLENDDE